MQPFITLYKSIRVSWFMVFLLGAIALAYGVFRLLGKESKLQKNELEDAFFYVLVMGLVGARLGYVLTHLSAYIGNYFAILRPSRFSLSLTGGIAFGLGTLFILSKRYKKSFYDLLHSLTMPFYVAMTLGMWSIAFDPMVIATGLGKNPATYALAFSVLFFIGLIAEALWGKDKNDSKFSLILLGVVLSGYYVVKNFL